MSRPDRLANFESILGNIGPLAQRVQFAWPMTLAFTCFRDIAKQTAEKLLLRWEYRSPTMIVFMPLLGSSWPALLLAIALVSTLPSGAAPNRSNR